VPKGKVECLLCAEQFRLSNCRFWPGCSRRHHIASGNVGRSVLLLGAVLRQLDTNPPLANVRFKCEITGSCIAHSMVKAAARSWSRTVR